MLTDDTHTTNKLAEEEPEEGQIVEESKNEIVSLLTKGKPAPSFNNKLNVFGAQEEKENIFKSASHRFTTKPVENIVVEEEDPFE